MSKKYRNTCTHPETELLDYTPGPGTGDRLGMGLFCVYCGDEVPRDSQEHDHESDLAETDAK